MAFDRYTEGARRAMFLTRYETSQRGGQVIEAEHLLLGVVRDARGVTRELLTRELLTRVGITFEGLQKQVQARLGHQSERISTSVELPFSKETRGVLMAAQAEADGMGHAHVGPEHLLLGLLRESGTAASLIVAERLNLDVAREAVRQATRG